MSMGGVGGGGKDVPWNAVFKSLDWDPLFYFSQFEHCKYPGVCLSKIG